MEFRDAPRADILVEPCKWLFGLAFDESSRCWGRFLVKNKTSVVILWTSTIWVIALMEHGPFGGWLFDENMTLGGDLMKNKTFGDHYMPKILIARYIFDERLFFWGPYGIIFWAIQASF